MSATTTYLWKGKTAKGEILSGEYEADRQDARWGSTCASAGSSSPRSRRSPRTSSSTSCRRRASGSRTWPSSPGSSPPWSTPVCRWSSVWTCWAGSWTSRTSRTVVMQVTADVEGGSTLAEALEKHPRGVQRPVREHDRRRRGRRYPGRDPAAVWPCSWRRPTPCSARSRAP